MPFILFLLHFFVVEDIVGLLARNKRANLRHFVWCQQKVLFLHFLLHFIYFPTFIFFPIDKCRSRNHFSERRHTTGISFWGFFFYFVFSALAVDKRSIRIDKRFVKIKSEMEWFAFIAIYLRFLLSLVDVNVHGQIDEWMVGKECRFVALICDDCCREIKYLANFVWREATVKKKLWKMPCSRSLEDVDCIPCKSNAHQKWPLFGWLLQDLNPTFLIRVQSGYMSTIFILL